MEMHITEKLLVNNRLWNYILKKIYLPKILNLVDKVKGNVLEIGSGMGLTTMEVYKTLPNVSITAIDSDIYQVNKARKLLPRNLKDKIKFLQGDATDLRFKNNSFEAVFEFNVFHHIKDYEKAIKEVKRVLKKNGKFYIMDISQSFFIPVIRHLAPPESLFTKQIFVKKLTENGFNIQVSSGKFFIYIKAIKQ